MSGILRGKHAATIIAVVVVATTSGCALQPVKRAPQGPASAHGVPAQVAAASVTAEQFAVWLAGDWDNFAQVDAARASGDAGAGTSNVATRLHVVRVALASFGDRVLYAEWRDRDDAKVLRQRLYAVEPGAVPGELRVKLHIFAQDDAALIARTAGAWRDPAKLQGLTPGDMAAAKSPGLAGCDLFFTVDGEGFAGAMRQGDCIVSPEGVEPRLYSWTQMRLGPSAFSYLDGWFHADGRPFQRFSGDWYRFARSR